MALGEKLTEQGPPKRGFFSSLFAGEEKQDLNAVAQEQTGGEGGIEVPKPPMIPGAPSVDAVTAATPEPVPAPESNEPTVIQVEETPEITDADPANKPEFWNQGEPVSQEATTKTEPEGEVEGDEVKIVQSKIEESDQDEAPVVEAEAQIEEEVVPIHVQPEVTPLEPIQATEVEDAQSVKVAVAETDTEGVWDGLIEKNEGDEPVPTTESETAPETPVEQESTPEPEPEVTLEPEPETQEEAVPTETEELEKKPEETQETATTSRAESKFNVDQPESLSLDNVLMEIERINSEKAADLAALAEIEAEKVAKAGAIQEQIQRAKQELQDETDRLNAEKKALEEEYAKKLEELVAQIREAEAKFLEQQTSLIQEEKDASADTDQRKKVLEIRTQQYDRYLPEFEKMRAELEDQQKQRTSLAERFLEKMRALNVLEVEDGGQMVEPTKAIEASDQNLAA